MKLYNDTVRQLIKTYKKSSVIFLCFKRFFFTLIIPIFILNIFIFILYNVNVITSVEKNVSTEYEGVVTSINSSLDECRRVIDIISGDQNFQQFTGASNYDTENTFFYESLINLRSLMSNLSHSINFIDSIHVYSEVNGYVLSTRNSNFCEQFYKKDIINNVPKNGI